jgi:MFS family permease
LFGALGLVLCLLSFSFSDPKIQTSNKIKTQKNTNKNSLFLYARSNKLLFASLISGFSLITTVNSAVVSWLPTYMGRAFGWPPEKFGLWLGIVSVISAASLFVNGLVVDTLFRRGMIDAHVRFYSWLVGLLVPICALSFLVTSPWFFLLLYGLMQALAFTYVLYMSATIQLIVPSQLRGRTAALFAFCLVMISMSVGPTLVAGVTDFVFNDPNKLGWSIGIVATVASTGAFLALRISLKRVKSAILGQQSDLAAEPIG